MAKIMAVNAGSSSLKFQLLDMQNTEKACPHHTIMHILALLGQ